METLSSTRHPRLRKFRSLLREARARKEAGLCVAEGPKLAQEALAAGVALREFLVTAEFMGQACHAGLLEGLRKAGARGSSVPESLFANVSDAESPQGIMVSLEPPRPKPMKAPAPGEMHLAAHELQDPGNLGTLLRSARACGVAQVHLGPGCADAWSPKALRAGAGAQFGLSVNAGVELLAMIKGLKAKGVQCLAMEAKGSIAYTAVQLGQDACLVLVGSEGRGLPPEMAECCSQRVRIDYPGNVESLNAGVAGTILLFEILKKKSFK